MSNSFGKLSNIFGAYIAFAPLVYFTVNILTGSFYKAMTGVLIVIALVNYLQQIVNAKRVKTAGKAVLITGCDSGFGSQAAHCLANMGIVVFAGCLNAEKAAENVLKFVPNETEPNYQAGGKIIPVQIDVTSDQQVEEAKNLIEKIIHEENRKFWAVVNNAGLGLACEIELTSMETCKKLFDVNFFGVFRVTKAFIPLLRYSKGSRIVNISSILGFEGWPSTGIYSASKSAILRLSESLRIEMLKFDIQVVSICPDFYKTVMTSTEILVSGFDAEIARLPENIRDVYYGELYLDFQRQLLRKKDKITMTRRDLSPVIDSICESVLCHQPRPIIQPIAWHSRFARAALTSWAMPQVVADWLLITVSGQDRIPVNWVKLSAAESHNNEAEN